jgi:hypothetical protein
MKSTETTRLKIIPAKDGMIVGPSGSEKKSNILTNSIIGVLIRKLICNFSCGISEFHVDWMAK